MMMKRYLIALLLLAGFITGCRTVSKHTLGSSGQMSPARLRDELDRFEYLFIDEMVQVSKEMHAADESRRTKREILNNRIRIIEALHAMMGYDNPEVAYVDTWGLIVRLRQYFEGSQGEQLFGQNQPKAVASISKTEIEIHRIGKSFIDPVQFERARKSIENFASEHPITGVFSNLIVFATQEDEEHGVLAAIVQTPMAPIEPIKNDEKTGDAIIGMRNAIDRYTGLVRQFPEYARWQLTVLMDDFEEAETTRSMLGSLDKFSQSSATLGYALDSVPAELRGEMLTVLEESNQTQQELQTALKMAEPVVSQVEKTLGELQITSLSINQTAKRAADTANAWKNASDSIRELIAVFDRPKPSMTDTPSFGMQDFDIMLFSTGQTADKVAKALKKLNQSNKSSGRVERKIRSLIDHVSLCVFQLILAIFALMLVLTLFKRKCKIIL